MRTQGQDGRLELIRHDQRLLRQLQIIAQFHPWYTDTLMEFGIQLNRFADEGGTLDRLPLMDAAMLDRHYYASRPEGGEEWSVYLTSGTSTGLRKQIFYSEEDDKQYIRAKADSFREWLGDDLPRGSRALADLGTGHAASTALGIFANLGLKGEAIAFTLPIEEHIAKLRSFKPHLLYTMPSILEAIADAAPHSDAMGIRKIIVVGEIASSEWQSRMAARFGLTAGDVLDTYGSIEIGAIASFSHRLGKYVLSDGLFGESLPAEQIDADFAPLNANEGVLVLTSYVRSLFPAVRFVTYDVVRDFETIMVDGKERQTFSCIAKRIGPELKHGEKISLYDIEAAVNRHLADASLRVTVQNNLLTLHIKSEQLDDAKVAAVQHEVEHQIADIGAMIRNRLLRGINIVAVKERRELPSGTVKSKKLYQ